MWINTLVFYSTPQPFNKNIIIDTPTMIYADSTSSPKEDFYQYLEFVKWLP
ncbi:MAG: hypothetical protein HFI54_13845 [Lachnospiraceae bacterium]|nr:hypothetical protein [Lachnospiraceae bacterium]